MMITSLCYLVLHYYKLSIVEYICTYVLLLINWVEETVSDLGTEIDNFEEFRIYNASSESIDGFNTHQLHTSPDKSGFDLN